jgi:hypothetical protein
MISDFMAKLSEIVKDQEFLGKVEQIYASLNQESRIEVEKRLRDIGEFKDQCMIHGISNIINPSTRELYIAAMNSMGLLDEAIEESGYLNPK